MKAVQRCSKLPDAVHNIVYLDAVHMKAVPQSHSSPSSTKPFPHTLTAQMFNAKTIILAKKTYYILLYSYKAFLEKVYSVYLYILKHYSFDFFFFKLTNTFF